MRIDVVLNAKNPIYPKQLKKVEEEIGINISAFQSLTVIWTDFTNSDVQMKLMGKPEYKNGKLHKGGAITHQTLNNSIPGNPYTWPLDPEKKYYQILFFLVNRDCKKDIRFTVVLDH